MTSDLSFPIHLTPRALEKDPFGSRMLILLFCCSLLSLSLSLSLSPPPPVCVCVCVCVCVWCVCVCPSAFSEAELNEKLLQ